MLDKIPQGTDIIEVLENQGFVDPKLLNIELLECIDKSDFFEIPSDSMDSLEALEKKYTALGINEHLIDCIEQSEVLTNLVLHVLNVRKFGVMTENGREINH